MKTKTIVYAYVVGDILHKGHLLHLRNAKALGDVLVVGVLTEKAVLEKKPNHPIMDYTERRDLVASLDMVDLAIPQDEYSPVKNVWSVRPDVLVESSSHDKEVLMRSLDVAKKIEARMVTLPYYEEQSSSKIKDKIKNNREGEER